MARRKDGRPNTLPLFVMLDPLAYTDGTNRYPINFDGTLNFLPRDGYSDNIEDYA